MRLPSGARTKAGLEIIPRNRSSAWKSTLIYCMIMADLQTRRDRHSEGPELLADAPSRVQ